MKLEHRNNIALFNVLNKEVVFEEYFCNLLRIDSFRNMFLEFIGKQTNILNKLEIQYNNFDTEVSLDKNNHSYGRADLFLQVEEKKFIFEIKNKIWTDLTVKQPVEYLKYLDAKNEHLFFLIPKGYKHLNSEDGIIERWSNQDFKKIKNQIFYWEDLVKEIKTTGLNQKNVEIQIFYEFCEYWFDLKSVELKREEMELLKDENLPSLMQKLEEITRSVGNLVGMDDKFDTIGYMYTKVVNDYRVYFGIDYDIWNLKKLPLSILIQNIKSDYQEFELKLDNIKLEKMEYEETNISDKQFGYIVLLDEEVGSSDYQIIVKDVLEDLIKQLKQT